MRVSSYSTEMNRIRLVSMTVVAAAVLILPVPAAAAAPLSLFGTTVSVMSVPSGDSLLGGTSYVPITADGGLIVETAAPLAEDVLVQIIEAGTESSRCTIQAGFTQCSMSSAGVYDAGANPVTVRFTKGAIVIDYTGTVYAVTDVQPSVRLEWRDAAGTWVDGSLTAVPLLADTAMRCVVTNNSNAPITLETFAGSLSLPSGSLTDTITDELQAGETGEYVIWEGPVDGAMSATCSGPVGLRDGRGTGNGTGGGVIALSGQIMIDRPFDPGSMVRLTGSGLLPPTPASLRILFDGVEVEGSPVTVADPTWGFAIDVQVPADLPPGNYSLDVVGTYGDNEIAFASFPLTVPAPALAATGMGVAPFWMTPLVLLGAGALLIMITRRWSANSALQRA